MARRRRKNDTDWGNIFLIGVGVVLVFFIAWTAYQLMGGGGGAVSGVESFPSEGRQHVTPGTNVDYNTDPPTSGPHYIQPVAAQFLPPNVDENLAEEALVHNLEHGNIVIYYQPELSGDPLAYLEGLPQRHNGTFDGVVVLPRQQDEDVILTAWRHMLRLDEWDQGQVEAFINEYRGRGPENPVR